MRLRHLIPILAIVGSLAFAATPAAAAVPQGFVGVNVDGPFFYPAFDQNGQMSLMVSSGVESMRMLFDWAVMEPYKNFSSVPGSQLDSFQNVGGVPTNFTTTDNVVRLAAIHHITLLAQIEYAPRWDSRHPGSSAAPPKTPGPYATFVRALVKRYGTRGTFWAANPAIPKVPIRLWQIWNEPNFSTYWSQQPWEKPYLRLIRAAHDAIKAADPRAKVVLAGLANYSWQYLANVYKAFGRNRKLFDVVAIHPFSRYPSEVITILKKVRALMNQRGDRNKPIVADEFSWPSAKGKARATFETATSEAGQAQRISQMIPLLSRYRKKLKLMAFYYYNWVSNETLPNARLDQFNYAGLLRFINGVGPSAKPALRAFATRALAIEGCRSKSLVATDCNH